MADRYWVGGSGIWNFSNTANWASVSGGSGGASAPGFSDNVFFDANSGVGTITVSVARANNFTTTGFTGTFAPAVAAERVLFQGNVLLGSGGDVSQLGLEGVFNSPQTATINTNGRTINSLTVRANSGDIVSLSGPVTTTGTLAFDLGSGGTINTNNYALNGGFVSFYSQGTLNIGASVVTGASITYGLNSVGASIVSTGLNTAGALALGGSGGGATGSISISSIASTTQSININMGSAAATLPATLYASSSVTIASGTCSSTISLIGSGSQKTVSVDGVLSALNTNQATMVVLSGAGTVSTFTSSSTTTDVQLNSNFAVNALTIAGPSGTVLVHSNVSGTARTLTANTSYSLSNISWRDITAAGNIPFRGTRFIDLGNNTNIAFSDGNSLFFGSNF